MADVITHAEAEELAALAVLGALEPQSRARLEHHLDGCAQCRATAQGYARAVSVLPDSLEPATPSPELRRRVLAAVYGEQRPQRRAWGLRSLWNRLPQGRAFTAAAALAAAAAIALAVWGGTRGGPSEQHFAVVPTAVQASAHGQLTYFPDASRAVLSVSGLSGPGAVDAASRVYEVWLIPRQGAPVAAAFLTPVPQTSTWTAVLTGNVLSYRTIATTIEPPGGTVQPTGPQVFSVALSQ